MRNSGAVVPRPQHETLGLRSRNAAPEPTQDGHLSEPERLLRRLGGGSPIQGRRHPAQHRRQRRSEPEQERSSPADATV